MKRFHVNVTVENLQQSTLFYETLFGEKATVTKDDYAKWMLEDPRINFSITESEKSHGINHVGLQVESEDELAEIQSRLDQAGEKTIQQPEAECCYAKSSKTWVRDPDDVAWETFVTHDQTTHYGNDLVPGLTPGTAAPKKAADTTTRCCA